MLMRLACLNKVLPTYQLKRSSLIGTDLGRTDQTHVLYKPTTPILYCSQSVFVFYSRPLENNRKWVWYVYKQHNNLVVGLKFEIQDLALRARS